MAAPTDVCEVRYLHRERVEKIEPLMEDEDVFFRLAEFYKALGDPTRTKILYALSQSELCVCDISYLLKMSDSAVSHQLRVLRNTRLVKYRKRGRMVYYSLDDKHVKVLLKQGLEHARE